MKNTSNADQSNNKTRVCVDYEMVNQSVTASNSVFRNRDWRGLHSSTSFRFDAFVVVSSKGSDGSYLNANPKTHGLPVPHMWAHCRLQRPWHSLTTRYSKYSRQAAHYLACRAHVSFDLPQSLNDDKNYTCESNISLPSTAHNSSHARNDIS